MSNLEASNPLHFQEEFLRAKRNLMWFCSLSIIIFFAGISEQDSNATNIPILAISINIDYLIALNSAVCFYHFMGFRIAEKRQRIFNSNTNYLKKFKSIDDVLSNTLAKINEPVNLLTGSFDNLIEKNGKNIGDAITKLQSAHNAFDHFLAEYHDDASNFEELQRRLIDTRGLYEIINAEKSYDFFGPGDYKKIGSLIDNIDNFINDITYNNASYGLVQKSKRELMYVNRELSNIKNVLVQSSGECDALQKASLALEKIQTSFNTLSGDISNNEKSKLLWFDNIPAVGIYCVSVILTVLHFAIKY